MAREKNKHVWARSMKTVDESITGRLESAPLLIYVADQLEAPTTRRQEIVTSGNVD